MSTTDEALADMLDKYVQTREQISYSVPHAAEKLDIGVRTMWRMVASGKVKSIKIKGCRRITAKELARLITDAERQAG